MSLELLNDRRVRAVPWRDLAPLTRAEVVQELSLPVPWLAGSLLLAHLGLVPLALPASFVFFLLGLRVVHGAYHNSLGLGRAADDWVMVAFSVLMLGSMHAVRFNHLRHHKHCLDGDDIEGQCALMPAWRALLAGPWFPVHMHAHALRQGGPEVRCWVVFELALDASWIVMAFAILDVPAMRYHVAAMAVGQCLTGFFAVWTVHHGCDRSGQFARTLRGGFKNAASFSMFLHLEHHLFPRVPTRRLRQLSRRLDAALPGLSEKQVF